MRKKNVLVVCFVILALVMTSASLTFAKNKAVFKTLKPGKWISAKKFASKYNPRGYYRYTVFKIKVPRDSILNLSKKGIRSRGYGYIAPSKKDILKRINYKESESEEVDNRVALKKGTYYMYLESGYYYGKTDRPKYYVKKMKYSLKKVSYPSNYSAATASKLKANKKVTAVYFAENLYSRWYKIKLKKNKAIQIDENGDGIFNLYDSDMNKIDMKSKSNYKYYTSSRQKKGTYFLEVRKYYEYETEYLDSITRFGEIYSIKWK